MNEKTLRIIAIIIALVYLPMFVYAIINIQYIKIDPCNYCEERGNMRCYPNQFGTPTGVEWYFEEDVLNLTEEKNE